MRHRLFHAIVLVGAALPVSCGSDGETPPATDAAPRDSMTGSETSADATASETVVDAGEDTAEPTDTNEEDAEKDCENTCGPCLPCIR